MIGQVFNLKCGSFWPRKKKPALTTCRQPVDAGGTEGSGEDDEFAVWLTKNNLSKYQEQFTKDNFKLKEFEDYTDDDIKLICIIYPMLSCIYINIYTIYREICDSYDIESIQERLLKLLKTTEITRKR